MNDIQVASWNVNSVRVRADQIVEWLRENPVQILCLQETKVPDDEFPAEVFAEAGYDSDYMGQKTYNGVAVLHRVGISILRTGLPSGFLDQQKRLISFSSCGITFINVYVPNGGDVDSPRFQDKLKWLDDLLVYSLEIESPAVILGDFNVAPGPQDTHSPDEQDGSVCYHPLERERIAEFHKAGFKDVFRIFNPEGRFYSWWDYRAGAFRRNRGMRLDLALANGPARKLMENCTIHDETRGWERPSDHVPISILMRTAE